MQNQESINEQIKTIQNSITRLIIYVSALLMLIASLFFYNLVMDEYLEYNQNELKKRIELIEMNKG